MINQLKLTKILRHIITVGVFSIIFVPLVINNIFFFPFIVPRHILFRIAVEVIFFTWLILLQIDTSFRPQYQKWNKLVWLILAFFGMHLLATILGIGWYRSFWGNYERMDGLFHLAHVLMYFIVLISVFKYRKDWDIFLTFSIFVGTVMSLLALSQWLGVPFLLASSGGSRLTGTIGNAAFLASYLIFSLFFILYFYLKEKSFSVKTFGLSFIIFDIFLITSSILGAIFKNFDWGLLNFIKVPILWESLKTIFNYDNLYSATESGSALKLLMAFVILQAIIFSVWYWRHKDQAIRSLLIVLLAFNGFIIFNTQTRGALIGLVISFGFLALVSLFLKVPKNLKNISAIILMLIVVSPLFLFGARNTSLVQNNSTLNRLATISLSDTTTETRLLTWQASWRGLTENPKVFLLGYGTGNYYSVFDQNFPVAIYKDAGSQIWFDYAHNVIFDTASATGVIGLVIYLSILIYTTWLLYQRYSNNNDNFDSWLLIGLLIAYFVQNLFVFDTLNTHIPFYLLLGFIVFLTSDKAPEANNQPQINTINYSFIAATLAVLVFGIFFLNIRPLQANHYVFKAIIDGQISQNDTPAQVSAKIDSSFNLFKQAIDQSLPGRFEARQQLADYVNKLMRLPNGVVPENKLVEMINYSADELAKSIDEEPTYVRHYLFLGTFLNLTTRYNQLNPTKVIDLMEEAKKLSSTRPQIYTELAQAHAFLGQYEKARTIFQQGVDLAPTVISGYHSILSLDILFEHFDAADQQFKLMQEKLNWQPTVQDYQNLINLYGRVKNYDKMIELQNLIITIDPSPQSYAQLASIYAEAGDKAKAKELINKAISLSDNQNFIAQAKAFLKFLETGELPQ